MPIITTKRKLRKRDPNDHYPTPLALAQAALDLWPYRRVPEYIADPGAGTGLWGEAARLKWDSPNMKIAGFDPAFGRSQWYTSWHGNFLGDWLGKTETRFDLIMGNPPYRDAEKFLRRSIQLTRFSGAVIVLLRLAFLGSQTRMKGFWKQHPPTAVYVLGKRPSFTGDRRTDSDEYAIFTWFGPHDFQKSTPMLRWLEW